MEPNIKRLYRSRSNKMLAGVCGGVAEYLGVDPTVARLLAVVIPGFGWVAYIICAIIIPEEPVV